MIDRRSLLGAAAGGLVPVAAPAAPQYRAAANIIQQDWDAFWVRLEALCNGLDTVTRPYPIAGAPVWPNRNARAAEARSALRDLDRAKSDADLRRRLRALAGTTTRPVKILCLGDSITVGAGSVDGAGYRTHLAALLDREDVAASIVSDAVSGSTLTAVAGRLSAALTAHAGADVVLLLVGTNDSAWADLTGWQAQYLALVDRILASSATVKVACAKMPISDTLAQPVIANPAVPANQATINGWISAAVTARKGTGRVVLADMSVIPSPWMLDGPGWHPGDAGYLRMAQIWQAAIAPWLPRGEVL